jgi:hypothetical protein
VKEFSEIRELFIEEWSYFRELSGAVILTSCRLPVRHPEELSYQFVTRVFRELLLQDCNKLWTIDRASRRALVSVCRSGGSRAINPGL